MFLLLLFFSLHEILTELYSLHEVAAYSVFVKSLFYNSMLPFLSIPLSPHHGDTCLMHSSSGTLSPSSQQHHISSTKTLSDAAAFTSLKHNL